MEVRIELRPEDCELGGNLLTEMGMTRLDDTCVFIGTPRLDPAWTTPAGVSYDYVDSLAAIHIRPFDVRVSMPGQGQMTPFAASVQVFASKTQDLLGLLDEIGTHVADMRSAVERTEGKKAQVLLTKIEVALNIIANEKMLDEVLSDESQVDTYEDQRAGGRPADVDASAMDVGPDGRMVSIVDSTTDEVVGTGDNEDAAWADAEHKASLAGKELPTQRDYHAVYVGARS